MVLHIITGLDDGGAEGVLYRLVCLDGAHRHHVVSLTTEGKYGPLLQRAGARVTCLNMPRGILTLRGLWRLWRLLRVLRPKVVQTWMYHSDLVGGTVARLTGVPCVCWGIRNGTLEPGLSKASTVWIARLNAALSHWVPQRIVCCAESALEIHAAMGYAREKMVVIPNGFDVERFRPNQEARRRLRYDWHVDKGTFVIGMVGRWDPQKDHSTLFGAIAHLKRSGISFVCVLVGRGLVRENGWITQQVAKQDLENHVLLLGQRTDIHDVMNAFDVHVLSSAYGEAFPNVVAEAMACGTPCITTDVGDAARIVGNTGWVVPPRNETALAQALLAAWGEWLTPEWRARQEAARRRVVDRFSLEKMVRAYRAVWEGSGKGSR